MKYVFVLFLACGAARAADCKISFNAVATQVIGSGYDTVLVAEAPTGYPVTVLWRPNQGMGKGAQYPAGYGPIRITASQYGPEFSGQIEIKSNGALIATYGVLITGNMVAGIRNPYPAAVCIP